MKQFGLLFVIFTFPFILNAQTTYRATHLYNIIDGKIVKAIPDHSLIIVNSDFLKVEIKSENSTEHFYFYGLAGKFTNDGEDWMVFNCRDKNNVKCRFVFRGKDQPVFEIIYEKSTISYYAEFVESNDL